MIPGLLRPRIPAPLLPLTRTGNFYLRAWWRVVRSSRGDIPVVRPTASLTGHVLLDETVLAGFKAVQRTAALTVPHLEAEVNAADAQFRDAGWLDAPATYHETPAPLTDDDIDLTAVQGLVFSYEDLAFDSGYEPHAGEPGRDRWLGYAANRRAHAWLLRHDEPRPWLVCVHGAQMGRPSIDLTLFRARWLHQELGLNVVLVVQPLLGPRRAGLPRTTTYPAADVLDDIHGAAQAVWDARRVIGWIRRQDPDARIGLTGVSLGGYVASMVASLEPDLDGVILGVPVVDLMAVLDQHAAGEADAAPIWARVSEPAHRIARVVSPLALQPTVAPNRRFIYAGLADRFVHPQRQILRLWEHWDRPEIHWYEGGHTLFFRSNAAARFVQGALVRSQLVDQPVAALAVE
jgi:hypothetical protein